MGNNSTVFSGFPQISKLFDTISEQMNCAEQIHILAFKHIHHHISKGTSVFFISQFLSSICTLLFENYTLILCL